MVSEQRPDEDVELARIRQEEAKALLQAKRLWDAAQVWPPADALGPVIDQLTGIEAALAKRKADFLSVFVHLGLLFGARCLGSGNHVFPDSADRSEALRRLRWADHNGPPNHLLAIQARMMLVFLLAPWAVPRADGTRPALLNALLDVADERVLTESMRRDLTEARQVVGRLAEAPPDPEFHEQTARVKEVIERMLSPGAASPGTTQATGAAPGEGPAPQPIAPAAAPGPAGAGAGAAEPHRDAAEEALLDAVRGMVSLAGSLNTTRYSRALVWLACEVQSRGDAQPRGDAHRTMALDSRVSSLLDRAAAGRAAGVAGVRRGADLALRALRALPPEAPERARVARLHAYLLAVAEVMEPGSADFGTAERPTPVPDDDSGDRLVDWPFSITPEPGLDAHLDGRVRNFLTYIGIFERRSAAHFERLLAHRTGDPGHLEDAAALLREAVEASAPDSWWVVSLKAELAEILREAATFFGSFHEADVSLATMRGLGAALRHDGSLPPDAPFALDLALSTADGELGRAERTGDHEALPRLLQDLRDRYAALPPDSSWRERFAQRLSRLEQLPADPQRTTARDTPTTDRTSRQEALERDMAEARRALDAPVTYFGQEYDLRAMLGLQLLTAVVRGVDDPAVLDEAIVELTRARALLAAGRGSTYRVDILTKLAEAHIMRAARRGPQAEADRRAFVEITREALAELAADVLLQIGADHGLSAALNGAVLSRRLAFVALRTGRPADAVEDLEKGRAVVLQAAAASRNLPQLLDAAGRPDLARQWRAQVPTDPLRPETGQTGLPPLGEAPIPSGLRRRALAVLGVRPGAGERPGVRQLLGVADVSELTDGLATTGTDALVYLVAGMPLPDGPSPGHALILRPGARPAMLTLPHLMIPGSAPLERYLDAAADRSRALADLNVHSSWQAAWDGHWQAALGELCEWAWTAVMGPVLAALRPVSAALWPLARPPRIVLVPCGRLGAVPWHAARIRGLGEHSHRYACQEAVISYAPSGTQFLAAAGRRRTAPAAGRQVLVADPQLTLPWAELETAALRTTCYPDALRYGEFAGTGETPDGSGTPEELLTVLPGGASPASVVHLSCHAVAAPRPTDSALWLARPPGADPEAGRLTVAGILDGAAGRRPDTAGPLVVLSACETDLSTRHHDEALTLATALVAGGAVDVVGSRWAVRDGPTAVMMTVFHHHLTAGGLAPPDALRAAQLWMLNPHRKLPLALDGPLRRQATRHDLHRLHHWAAFTHQGNPAPGPMN